MSVARRAGAAVLVIAALAAGRAVTSVFPSDPGINEPFLRPGAVGKPVSLRYADVTALRVDGARCVQQGVVVVPAGVRITEVDLHWMLPDYVRLRIPGSG